MTERVRPAWTVEAFPTEGSISETDESHAWELGRQHVPPVKIVYSIFTPTGLGMRLRHASKKLPLRFETSIGRGCQATTSIKMKQACVGPGN